MAGRDIIVVGASAGGVETLRRLVAELPEDLPAAVFVVLHMAPHTGSALVGILARQTKIAVEHPSDGDPVRLNRIYVALPDCHLALIDGQIRVTAGPKENGHRPAVDTLFRTAAASYGSRVVGVVLSGTRDDGTAGLLAIHARGGVAVVQDPEEAIFPGMPLSALAGDHPDHVLSVSGIAAVLSELARSDPPASEDPEETRAAPVADALDAELRWADPALSDHRPSDPPLGRPSGYTCPECHGGLWEIEDGPLPRYRCRVGHGYSAHSLLAHQAADVDAALWTAYRALDEQAALLRRLSDRARERQADVTAQHFRVEAAKVARQADMLKTALRTTGRTFASGEESPPDAQRRIAEG